MSKYLVVLLVILSATSCAKKDERYYQLHPQELQHAIKVCPDRQPKDITCQQLHEMARHINVLAYQLQQSPQGFGAKILALQEAIASQQTQLKAQGSNKKLQQDIARNEQTLSEYMAIVKWLESPVS